MNKEEICKKLDESIPRSVISERSGGGTRKLSYLETWYVIDRLNKVLGNLGWSSETVTLGLVPGETTKYMAKVRIIVRTEEDCVYKDGYGFGDAQKGSRVDHELAIKEAESDALKRAAMKFGLSMGLALYDKTQEFVTDEEPVTEKLQPQVEATRPPNKEVNVGQLRETIKNSAKILIDTRKITKPQFVDKYVAKFGADKVDTMKDESVTLAYAALVADFPMLKA